MQTTTAVLRNGGEPGVPPEAINLTYPTEER
jgi:hypothetical protein